MAVRTFASLALTATLLLPAAAEAADCDAQAQALLRKAESVSMSRRAPIILEGLRADAEIGCGVVPKGHWSSPPALPEGCTKDALDLCAALQALPVARQVTEDVEADLFVRVQQAAEKLAAAGHLKRAHKRLLQLLLLSDAIRRGG